MEKELKEIDEKLLNIINDQNGDYDYIVRQAEKARIVLQDILRVLRQPDVIKSVCDKHDFSILDKYGYKCKCGERERLF